VHTAATVQSFIAAKGIRTTRHQPYLPTLAPADYFLFLAVKRELAGKNLTHNTFKMSWDGVI